MFALSALAQSGRSRPIPLENGQPDLRALPDEYRFPVQGIPNVKIPKQRQAIADAIAQAGDEGPLLWTALAEPVHRVPFATHGKERTFALVSGVIENEDIVLLEVRIELGPGLRRNGPADLTSIKFEIARSVDKSVELLAGLWMDADPRARAAAGGATILWLGGNPARQVQSGDLRIQALCAAFGLKAEVMADAKRHARELASRLGGNTPGVLVHWQPHARGLEPSIQKFRDSGEGQVVELNEVDLEDALVELQWALCELGFDGKPPPDAVEEPESPPVAGEERFYIKHYGTKKGDHMIAVVDCGHGQWGGDRKSKAPRAYKGIEAGVGVKPQAIFKCPKCQKNRWKARF